MVLNIAGDYMKSFTTKVGDKDGDKENEDAEEAKVGFLSLVSYVYMNLSLRVWIRTDTNGHCSVKEGLHINLKFRMKRDCSICVAKAFCMHIAVIRSIINISNNFHMNFV